LVGGGSEVNGAGTYGNRGFALGCLELIGLLWGWSIGVGIWVELGYI